MTSGNCSPELSSSRSAGTAIFQLPLLRNSAPLHLCHTDLSLSPHKVSCAASLFFEHWDLSYCTCIQELPGVCSEIASAAQQPVVVLFLLPNCFQILFNFQYLIWFFGSLRNNTYLLHWCTKICNNNCELFYNRCYWMTKVYYCKILWVGNLTSGTVLHLGPVWLLTMLWVGGEEIRSEFLAELLQVSIIQLIHYVLQSLLAKALK